MKKYHLLFILVGSLYLFATLQADGQTAAVSDSVQNQRQTTSVSQDSVLNVSIGQDSTISTQNRDTTSAYEGKPNTPSPNPWVIENQKMYDYWKSPENQLKLEHLRSQYQAGSGHRVRDAAIRNAVQKENVPLQQLEVPDYPESEYFYQIGTKKIPLRLSEDEMAIYFKRDTPETEIGNFLAFENVSSIMRSTYGYQLVRRNERSQLVTDRLNQISQKEQVYRTLPVFYTPHNHRVIVTDEIIIRFNPTMTMVQIRQFNARYHLDIIRKMASGSYLLRLRNGVGLETLKISAQCHNNPDTEWAQPNFQRHANLNDYSSPNDPLLNPPTLYQWHLQDYGSYADDLPSALLYPGAPDDDIDAHQAWAITKGSANVKIAILDTGVDLYHEDLAENTSGISHYDASESIHPKPQPIGSPDMNLMATVLHNAHGTMVAGIVLVQCQMEFSGIALSYKLATCLCCPDTAWDLSHRA